MFPNFGQLVTESIRLLLLPEYQGSIKHLYLQNLIDIKRSDPNSLARNGDLKMSELYFLFRMIDPILSRHLWQLLFASRIHGKSMSRLSAAMMDYDAPKVLIARGEDQRVVGACIIGTLSESSGRFLELTETFLFCYKPILEIIRASGYGKNFVFLNSRNKCHPRGLGFGGQQGLHRLWVSEDMKSCYTTSSDATFVEGFEVFPKNDEIYSCFELVDLEVWGAGRLVDYESSIYAKKRLENIKNSSCRFDKKKFYDNDFTRKMIFNANSHNDAGNV